MRVEEVNVNNSKLAYEFLSGVPSIDKIDEKILANAVLAYDSNKIIGCISFVEYDYIGLIRYFVFRKAMPNDLLNSLVDKLEENAIRLKLDKLVCIADSKQIEELFISLGFELVEENVYINEELLEEPYITEKGLGDCDLEFPYTVPGTGYFVMGDRRSNSVDSRNSVIGAVTRDDIIGKVFLRVWPFSRMGLVY